MTGARSPSFLHDQPPQWLVVVTLGVALFYGLVLAGGSPPLVIAANIVGPLTLAFATGLLALHLFLSRPAAAWTPYAWMLVSFMAFFCVGPLIYNLGGPRAVEYALSFLPIDQNELLRTNLLNAVGLLFLLLGVRVAREWGAGSRRPTRTEFATHARLKILALGFLALGGALNLAVMYPYFLGLTHGIVPGVLLNLGNTYLLGLLILAYLVAKGERRLLVPLVLLWIPQILVMLASFDKRQLILSIMVPALGTYLARPTFARLALTATLVILTFFFTERLVLWGRTEYDRLAMPPRTVLAAMRVRLGIVENYLAAASEKGRQGLAVRVAVGSFPNYALAWGRLNYAPEQWFAMRLRADGTPGHTLASAAYIFIPRLLWPGKPKITNIGVNFYALASGHYSSNLGVGIFGEGYWDDGWIGVIGLAFLTGILFAVLSNRSALWIEQQAFQYFPSILLGLKTGALGLTGYFVTSIMGASGFFVVYAAASYAVTMALDFYQGSGEQAARATPTGR